MTETTVNAMEVFKRYGLEAKEVEPAVYKVLNTDKEIDVDELQLDLKSCILITSDDTSYRKLPTGMTYILAYAYYIITDRNKRELGYKYKEIADKEFGESIYNYYEYRPEYEKSIDTIYAKGEI